MNLKQMYGAIEIDADFSARLNEDARYRASFARPGAVVYAATSVEHSPAPAWYEINSGDVYIDLSQLGVNIDLITGPAGYHGDDYDRDMSIVTGVMLHELAHSKWTDWSQEDFDSKTRNTMVLFEEGRIERNVVNSGGEPAMNALRAAFSNVLLPGFIAARTSTPYVTAANYALVAGRVHAGHIGSDEIIDVELATRGVLGDDIVDVLDEILGQALQCRTVVPEELAQYAALAEEWNAVLVEEFGAAAEPTSVIADETVSESKDTATASDSSDTDKAESETEPESESMDPFTDEPDDTEDESISESDSTNGLGDTDAADADNKGDDSEWLEDMDAAKVLEDALKRLGEKVLLPISKDPGRRSKPEEFASVFGSKPRFGRNWRKRPPSPAERKAATLLTRLFEEMSTPAIVKRKASSSLPPGRLRGREAVRMSADRAAGRMSTAQAWKVEKRKHDTEPPITVGIATDTSGSMKWAESMVASTAWIFATAGHRIGANIAAVTFGDAAEAVMRPREIPNEIRTRRANGGTEAFDDAMAALDGVLRYTDGKPGRKVLLIVSDAQFVRRNEPAKRRAWMKAFAAAGVEVIWANNDVWYLERTLSEEEIAHSSIVSVTPGDYESMVRTVTAALNR